MGLLQPINNALTPLLCILLAPFVFNQSGFPALIFMSPRQKTLNRLWKTSLLTHLTVFLRHD